MRTKHQNKMRNYSWSEVVTAYLGTNGVAVLDDVVIMSPKVDKAAECLYSQLIAIFWGVA